MAHQRKSKARKGWGAVVKRLSGEAGGKAPSPSSGAGHQAAVGAGKPRRVGRVGSVGENLLEAFLRAELITGWEREYHFHPTRKWRFDFAWPAEKVAVEVEGGVWSNGRHTRGSGFIEDCIKYNEAVVLGWKVIRVTTEMVRSGVAIDYIKRMGD